jgi:diguanylate cyclase (GGDEF)-like protein
VLALGEPTIRPKEEKLALQMITNLGAIAYRNVRNVRLLREQANHDGLTGLLNRRSFMVDLGCLIHAATRRANPLAVFMFDIDNFKRYNDSNGHQAGDEVLKGVAEVLRANLRPQDLACRYGGEEFIVAMPLTDAEQAFQAAERIREAIASHPFAHRETQPNGVLSISGGVSVFPMDGQDSTDLIRHADQALYKAKAAGRNRVTAHKGIEMGDGSSDFLGLPADSVDVRTALRRPTQ